MLPQHVVPVETIALTPNGKVDRRALPRPTTTRGDASAYVAPRTATEEILAGIWAQVLGLPQVSIDASFFALGGHSLKVMQVVARVRQTLGVELAVGELFAAPTVARLAAAIDAQIAQLKEQSRQSALTLTALSGSGIAPRTVDLSFAQQRLWFLDQVEAPSTAYVIQRALRLTGTLDVAAPRGPEESLRIAHALFFCEQHQKLVGNASFQDNLLHALFSVDVIPP